MAEPVHWSVATLIRDFAEAVRLAGDRARVGAFEGVVWVEREPDGDVYGDVEAGADEVTARVAFAQVPYDLIYIRTDA
jgi:hypothetical protein